ncbi:MAG: TraB/GumN family protein [Cyclobacteriaceae bacterium]|nr:TraB/GumN family protein [Cyclobacteriaceae bacterium]
MKKNLFILLFLASTLNLFSQNSILWEVSGNGLKTPSYVMGTLKFIGEKEFFIPKEAVSAMKSSKIFAIEDQVDHKAQGELNKAVHFPKGKSLKTELPAIDYQRLTDFFQKEFNISPSRFESEYAHLIPLALSINMTRMSLGESVKYYDIELLTLAKKNKLKTYSLEPIERESQAIQAFPMKDQEVALLHSIANFEKQKTEYKNLEDAYTRGDLDKVFEYSLHPTENNPAFIEAFYTKRNQEWIAKIDKMINDKPSFIAIGVSHLEGDKGILSLLKEKGYTLTPVKITK